MAPDLFVGGERWEREAPAASLFVGTRPGLGLCRNSSHGMCYCRVSVGLGEGDAWHAEQGLAGFLGTFDVCDLEEPFGRVVEEPG